MTETRKTPQIRAYWREFAAAHSVAHDDYSVFAFGDGAEMADELLGLVLAGDKRATAGLVRDFEAEGEPIPEPGDHAIVLDGAGAPRCILRTSDVQIAPLSATDATFAWDEAEGDRSLAWWMDAHVGFFTRQAEADGFAMHPDIDTVLERFEVVWPERPVTVRPETVDDVQAVHTVTRDAFAASDLGDSGEAALVDAVRSSHADDIVSLVAERDGAVVGHILFSPVTVGDARGMGLAPMAVAPGLQRCGIGAELIRAGLKELRARQVPFVVVLGHPRLYRRFGFRPATERGVACAWGGVPEDAWMVLHVTPDIPLPRGTAHYLPEFAAVAE